MIKKDIVLAKLDVIRSMTETEGVKQLVDLLSDIVSDNQLLPEGTSAIGFMVESEEELKGSEIKKK